MSSTQTNTNEYIDKITLELLINKTQYNKYLSITDPAKYKKISEFSEKLGKYGDLIRSVTDEYCSNTKTQKSNEMDEMFINYAKTCIRYFEMKELEGDPESYSTTDKDEVLFAQPTLHSFWGKGAIKRP